MEEENIEIIEEEEESEVEVTEISLSEDEIDEWIEKLVELKENHEDASFELDDENELLIKFDDSVDEETEEEDDAD